MRDSPVEKSWFAARWNRQLKIRTTTTVIGLPKPLILREKLTPCLLKFDFKKAEPYADFLPPEVTSHTLFTTDSTHWSCRRSTTRHRGGIRSPSSRDGRLCHGEGARTVFSEAKNQAPKVAAHHENVLFAVTTPRQELIAERVSQVVPGCAKEKRDASCVGNGGRCFGESLNTTTSTKPNSLARLEAAA